MEQSLLAEITASPFLSEMYENAKRQSKKQGTSFEYLEGALDHVLMFTRAKLTPQERVQFLLRLSKYQKSKLERIGDFTGRLGDLFSFLDSVNAAPYLESAHESIGYYDQLPPPADNKQIGKDVREHVARMIEFMSDGPMTKESLAEKRRVEKEGLTELHKKYPAYGFDMVLREKRFS